MFNELKQLLQNSYAPYSNYKVACILKMKDGNIVRGVNVENASYGATICAERNAINAAITKGYKKGDFSKIYLMVSSDSYAMPCFVCRQTILEFFDMEDELILVTSKGEKSYKIKDFITLPWGKEDLK